jgi:hypothetical protein
VRRSTCRHGSPRPPRAPEQGQREAPASKRHLTPSATVPPTARAVERRLRAIDREGRPLQQRPRPRRSSREREVARERASAPEAPTPDAPHQAVAPLVSATPTPLARMRADVAARARAHAPRLPSRRGRTGPCPPTSRSTSPPAPPERTSRASPGEERAARDAPKCPRASDASRRAPKRPPRAVTEGDHAPTRAAAPSKRLGGAAGRGRTTTGASRSPRARAGGAGALGGRVLLDGHERAMHETQRRPALDDGVVGAEGDVAPHGSVRGLRLVGEDDRRLRGRSPPSVVTRACQHAAVSSVRDDDAAAPRAQDLAAPRSSARPLLVAAGAPATLDGDTGLRG